MAHKILIADDNQGMLVLLEYGLKKQGYVVVMAKDGEEAVVKAQFEKPDLILMDISMPAMNGKEAGTLIQQDANIRNIPVIFLTALISEADGIQMDERRNSIVLPKGIAMEDLVKYIEEAIKNSKPR